MFPFTLMIPSDCILLSVVFFSQIISMQLQHNTKTTWIKLTKQYEGNGTVDDVLPQVLQFDDTCLFFLSLSLSNVHISHCSTCLNSPSSFVFFRLIKSPHFTVSFNTCYTPKTDVYFIAHIPYYWLCWGHRHVDTAQHVL